MLCFESAKTLAGLELVRQQKRLGNTGLVVLKLLIKNEISNHNFQLSESQLTRGKLQRVQKLMYKLFHGTKPNLKQLFAAHLLHLIFVNAGQTGCCNFTVRNS